MRPLRVLHCRQSDRIWGPERQIAQLAQHLPEFGIGMELVLLRRWGLDPEPHPLVEEVRQAGGRAVELSARPQDVPGVIRHLRQRLATCDLLHTHEFKGDLLGMAVARVARKPWVATDHHLATDDEWLLRLFGYADRWALARAAAVVVPSQSQASRLAGRVAADRIRVIHHGIDAAAFARLAGDERSAWRQRFGVEETQPVVSVFGRLEPVKGHSDFLLATQQLLRTRPDLRFWIVGEGRLDEGLRQQAQDLGVAHAVQFLGYQREVASLMAASDVIILPSRHESFGIVLIEAMSLARPVVASATGGIPEVVLDGANGYLAPPGDASELSWRVLKMLDNPAQAAQLGQAGRERVRQIFTVERMAEQMAQLYRRVSQPQDEVAAADRRRKAKLSLY